MQIQTYFLGSGRAAQALEKSLRIVQVLDREQLQILEPIHLKRGEPLPKNFADSVSPVLFIANPHGLHAASILEAAANGFKLIVVEKPAAVNLDELQKLKSVKIPVAVCHVYRQMWGPQYLKKMISSGDFGKIIAIEGRYWQSSTAQRALNPNTQTSWKNDPKLSGDFDTFLDVGTHWADLAVYLESSTPWSTQVWLSYLNAESPHRDSHVHLQMIFPSGTRAMASVSKTVHGAPNHFEVNIIGTLRSATWKFLEADIIEVGEGSSKTLLARTESALGSQQGPFHATGWLEGYVEIIRQSLRQLVGATHSPYPTLDENLLLLECLLKAEREKT